jgi:hypothetical protein
MAKLTAWLVTIVGIWLLLVQLGVLTGVEALQAWIVAIVVTIIGVSKLMRSYSKQKRR